MQFNSTSIQKAVPQHMVKTSLSQAVAGNRPLGSVDEIKQINPAALNILNTNPQSDSHQFDQHAEQNLLTQNQIEQAVADSGLFEFTGKNQRYEIATNGIENKSSKIQYDIDVELNRGAIQTYMMTQHAAKRDEIQQMVGIDLYV